MPPNPSRPVKRQRPSPSQPVEAPQEISEHESDENEQLIDDLDDVSQASARLTSGSQSVSGELIRASSTSSERRKKSSNIYEGMDAIHEFGERIFKCKYCTASYKASGGTKTPRDHLRIKHKVDLADRNAARIAVYDEKLEAAFARVPEQERLKKERHALEYMVDSLDKSQFMYLYLRWVIPANVSLNQVENKDFRAWLHYISKPANEMLPFSANTIKTQVHLFYNEGRKRMRQLLSLAISDIHITCDAWTSSNKLAFLGVVAHFVDENGSLRTLLLALREIIGAHSGENMASLILAVLEEYNIRNSLGYFVMDNAENNDTMLAFISKNLRDVNGIEFDPVERRLRCMGHIINLSVKAFLFGEHPDEPEEQEVSVDPNEEELQKYRKFGPQGKLHNITVYVMRTPQRIQHFKTLSHGLMPKRNHDIRWNAWYLMVDWSIRKEKVKTAIQSLLAEETDLSNDYLGPIEWRTLGDIRDFLEPFYQCTKLTEGRNATINRSLPVMDFLLDQYVEGLTKFADNDFMKLSIDAGWKKLQKYWNKTTELAPVYIAAIVLDPTQKWSYFEQHWMPTWIMEAKSKMQRLWRSYNTTPVESMRFPSPEEEDAPKFMLWMAKDRQVIPTDELEQYINEPIIRGHIDIIAWWRDQRTRLPTLTRMAMSVFSIPAMSSEPERVFSSTKHTITVERASLGPETIEWLECCKHWLKAEIYTDTELTALLGLLEEMEAADEAE